MTHDENAFVAVLEFSKELPAHDWNKKKSEIRHIEENKRNGLTLPILHPRQHSWVPRETFQVCDFFHGWEWTCVSEHLASPQLCRMPPGRPTSFSPRPEYWGVLHSSGVERAERTTGRALGGHRKDTGPTKCFVESGERPPTSHRICLTCKFLNSCD